MTPGSPNQASVVRSTWRALLEPQRLIPILLVSGPLILVQWRLSRDPLAAPLGVLLCLAFTLIAPLSYRVLFPDGIDFGHGAIRVLLYSAIGAGVVLTLGKALPELASMSRTLLTTNSSLIVCVALFLVGGWGLGRDIGLEASLLRERERTRDLLREAEHAQLLALRSHLDPHFLFNTLNAIAEWCREDGEVAERAVLQLSAILRAILAGVKSKSWSLSSELELLKDLFALHLLRDPDLFTLEFRLPSPLPQVLLPPMILLALAENAVKHGPAAGHRGVILIDVAMVGHTRVALSIENPGPYRGPRQGSDGLPTVERRLSLSYLGEASLVLSAADNRTRALMEIPVTGPVKGANV